VFPWNLRCAASAGRVAAGDGDHGQPQDGRQVDEVCGPGGHSRRQTRKNPKIEVVTADLVNGGAAYYVYQGLVWQVVTAARRGSLRVRQT